MAKCLVFLSVILASCCSNPVDHKIGRLNEPELIDPEPVWDRLPLEAQDIWTHNRQEWEDFYDDATKKVRAHDKSLERPF